MFQSSSPNTGNVNTFLLSEVSLCEWAHKGKVHPKMYIQSLSTQSHADGEWGEVL